MSTPITINTLKEMLRMRREIEELFEELKEFIENNDIEGKMETVCETPKIRFMCMPRGCVIHVMINDYKARYTLIISDKEPGILSTTIIDWAEKATRILDNEDLNKVLKEMNAEEDLKMCVERYVAEKQDLLNKLNAIKALFEMV
jgi:hypothetical protein